jgi:hypothetical protein
MRLGSTFYAAFSQKLFQLLDMARFTVKDFLKFTQVKMPFFEDRQGSKDFATRRS